jgi:hypothetical protein
MDSSPDSSSQPSDLFIVLEPFRTGFADFVRALEPLIGSPGDTPLVGSSDVYYRADTDIALLTIRLDRQALTPQKLAWLTSVAARADLPVLDPSRLGYSDRRAFYEDYLPNYRVRVEARGGPQEALEELARLLALPDAPPMRAPAPAPGPVFRPGQMDGEDSSRRTGTAPPASELNGRYGAARTVGHGAGARSASRGTSGAHPAHEPSSAGSPPARESSGSGRPKATEYAAQPRSAGRRRHEPAHTSPDEPRVRAADDAAPAPAPSVPNISTRGAAVYPLAREAAGQSSPSRMAPRDTLDRAPTPGLPASAPSRVIVPVPLPPRGATSQFGRPVGAHADAIMPATDSDAPLPEDVATGPTMASASVAAFPAPPREGASQPLAPAAAARYAGGRESGPPVGADSLPRAKKPALIVEDEESPLLVRFLRGDNWASGRLRALSLQGARLAAAAPPRLGDRVQLALGLDHLDVQLWGEVTQVTSAAQATGSGEPSGFAVHFGDFDSATRGKLVNLLKRAKQSGIALRPPPPRASVRFPVRWPAGVITSWGELNTAALDVSRSGLFLASGTVIGAREIIFHLPMDTTGRALSGRGQIAREVSEEMASLRGLSRGYGVRIIDFTRNDAERYDSFLERIRLRTEKRIMVAAHPERATDLGRGLIAAGYAVHSGNDLVALAESMNEAGPPPDAALIESSLLASDASAASLKRALHAKQVPCLTLSNEQPERARAVVDHLLHIT